MKKMGRIASCLICLILLGALFAGCASAPANTTGAATVGPTTAGTAAPSASDSEKAVLKALINFDNTMTRDPETMVSWQGFEEAANVDIQWEIIRTGWADKKTLLLASGDLPDMFVGGRTLTSNDIMTNKTLFVDLAKHLGSMPNVSKMLDEEPAMKNLVLQDDGSILYLPSRMPLRPNTFTCVFINQKWLTQLGLPMPTTLDEYEAVLKAFKDNDPNRNNKADELPLLANGTSMAFNALTSLFGSFGIAYNELMGEMVMVKDGKLNFVPTLPEYKEAVKFMRKLYSQGLVDKESFTQDGSQYMAKCYASDPQVVGVAANWTVASGVGEANKADYVTFPPLKGPTGAQGWNANPVVLSVTACTWSLTTSCENPEAAVRLIDHIYVPKNSVQLYFGSYGEGLDNTAADGTIKINEPTSPNVTYNDWIWEIGFGDMGPYYVSRDFEKSIIPNSWVSEKKDIDSVYLPFTPKDSEVYPPMLYSQEDTQEMSVLQTDVGNIVYQKLASWITGESDIDAEWDGYLQSLDGVGLQKLMTIYDKYWQKVNK